MHKRRFDLVLTDKNLPGASGLDVLRAARNLNPAPAIVLITGYSSFDSAVEALDIGAHDYIEKPIRDVEDLRFRIRRALSRRDEQLARPKPTRTGGRAGRVLLVEVEGQRRQLLAEYLGQDAPRDRGQGRRRGAGAAQARRTSIWCWPIATCPACSGLRVIEHAQRLLPHCASVLYTAYPSYDSVQGGVRGRRRRVPGAAERRSEEAGREGRGSARRPRRNPVRVKDVTDVTCASRSRTTCASPTAKTKPSSTAPRPSTRSPPRCARAGTRSRRSRSPARRRTWRRASSRSAPI